MLPDTLEAQSTDIKIPSEIFKAPANIQKLRDILEAPAADFGDW